MNENPTISKLMECYKQSKKCFDSNSEFKKQSQEEVVKLQSGNEDSIKIWRSIINVSMSEFNEVYKSL